MPSAKKRARDANKPTWTQLFDVAKPTAPYTYVPSGPAVLLLGSLVAACAAAKLPCSCASAYKAWAHDSQSASLNSLDGPFFNVVFNTSEAASTDLATFATQHRGTAGALWMYHELEKVQGVEPSKDSLEAVALRLHEVACDMGFNATPLRNGSLRKESSCKALSKRRDRAITVLQSAAANLSIDADLQRVLLKDPRSRQGLTKTHMRWLANCATVGLLLSRQGPAARPKMHDQRWTAEEKEQMVAGELPQGRSSAATQKQKERCNATELPVPFPDSTFNGTMPQRLEYDTWTTIDSTKDLPPNAEVAWSTGVARIPKAWTLILPPAAEASAENEDDLVLADIEANMTVAALLERARSILQARASNDSDLGDLLRYHPAPCSPGWPFQSVARESLASQVSYVS